MGIFASRYIITRTRENDCILEHQHTPILCHFSSRWWLASIFCPGAGECCFVSPTFCREAGTAGGEPSLGIVCMRKSHKICLHMRRMSRTWFSTAHATTAILRIRPTTRRGFPPTKPARPCLQCGMKRSRSMMVLLLPHLLQMLWGHSHAASWLSSSYTSHSGQQHAWCP